MRISALIVTAAAIAEAAALAGVPAAAQTEQQWDVCYGIGVPTELAPPEMLIDGCTAIIESGGHHGRNLAVAFANRGLGYMRTSQDERAFADFDQAIQLDPGCTPAYYHRSRLNWERGDLDRAQRDIDKLAELERREAEFDVDDAAPAIRRAGR
jgi:tetratricopeptide (TPR) repeat protein